MKHPGKLVLAALLAASVAARAQTPDILRSTLAETGQATAEVSTAEVRRALADGSPLVLDSRPRAQFAAGHIPGAHNLDAPASEAVAAVEKLAGGDRTKALILYCNGPFCQQSRQLAAQLAAAGFANARRYQLGIPVWRALGGPTQIELEGVTRIVGVDRTAVFFDARAPEEYARGSVADAHNAPVEKLGVKAFDNLPLPNDDFNRRVILFGRDGGQARALADVLTKRPWHNVSYFGGSFASLAEALKGR